jgi:hypothetical protein
MRRAKAKKLAITPADSVRAATADIGALHEQMTFLVQLTDTERQQHQRARIGMKTLRTIENRLVAARQHRNLLPQEFDMRKFERDTTTAVALSECLVAIDKMRDSVYDTLLAAGNRAAVASQSAYGHMKLGAVTAQRLQRTVDKLGKRMVRSTTAAETLKVVPAPANTEVPADEPVIDPAAKVA